MKFFNKNSFLLSILTLSQYKLTKSEEIKYHANSIENGTILHTFCWSFNTIKEKLPDIKRAGYTAIQTSPIQTCKRGEDGSKNLKYWYYHYQPISFEIGNYQLGTKEEFESLCSAAHQYGIKIIADAVVNHMTSDWYAINETLRRPDLYHSDQRKIKDDENRYQVTQNSLIGLYDLNTQNPDVQQYVLDFLKKAVAYGASGFRYDAAKHIELPDDYDYGGNFWPTVLNNGAEFQYGEVISNKASRDDSYAEYMKITASDYGTNLRDAIANNNFSVEKISNYNTTVSSNKLVTWVESHDTFSNNGLESVWLTSEQIKLSWALLAARNSTTPLFFSRPLGAGGTSYDSRFPGKSLIGDEGDPLYKNDEIAAVNLFRNAMEGENEILKNPNDNKKILMIERGTKGLVIINLDKRDVKFSSNTNLADGKYENRTNNNNIFYVSNGLINGTLPSRSVVVLYVRNNDSENNDDSSTDDNNDNNDSTSENITIYFKKPSSWSNSIYSYIYSENNNRVDKISNWPGIVMTNVENDIYSISFDPKYDNAYIIFNDYKNQSPGANKPGYIIKNNGLYTISGYSQQYSSSSNDNQNDNNQNDNNQNDSNTSNTIYFEKPSSWNDNIYAYIYSVNSKIVTEMKNWPGTLMNKINGTTYSITVDNSYENGYIIFTDRNQQIPSPGQTGFNIKMNGLYNSNGYVKQYNN